jgi:protein CpxP
MMTVGWRLNRRPSAGRKVPAAETGLNTGGIKMSRIFTASRIRKSLIGVAVVSALAVAGAVAAHGGPGRGADCGGPGMMGYGGPGMMGFGGPGPRFAHSDGDIEKFQQERLAKFKAKLNIAAAQQPAWDAYVAKASEQHKAMLAAHLEREKAAPAATAPERMKQQQQVMGEHLKSMASMTEAVTKLYDVLTPQQREVFDRFSGPRHRRG